MAQAVLMWSDVCCPNWYPEGIHRAGNPGAACQYYLMTTTSRVYAANGFAVQKSVRLKCYIQKCFILHLGRRKCTLVKYGITVRLLHVNIWLVLRNSFHESFFLSVINIYLDAFNWRQNTVDRAGQDRLGCTPAA